MKHLYIYQVYIADGFNEDCERLIQRCVAASGGKVTYEIFCDLWKEMNFDSLYRGRSSGAEIAELSEELVNTAKCYMINNDLSFEEAVVGLFIVYGLVNLQPYQGFAALRLIPEDIPSITRLEVIARRSRRLDVLYVLGAVLVQCAQCHAAERERGMESTHRKYLEGYMNIDRSRVRPSGVFHIQNEEFDVLKDMVDLSNEYKDFKKDIAKQNSQNLNFVDHNLSKELDTSLRTIIGAAVIEDFKDEVKDFDRQYSAVQEIKQRAMMAKVGAMKHLSSTFEADEGRERNINNNESTYTSDLKSKPGTIKKSSPTKPVTPKKGTFPAAKIKSSKRPKSTSPNKNSPKRKRKPTERHKGQRKSKRLSKQSDSETDSTEEFIDINISDFHQPNDTNAPPKSPKPKRTERKITEEYSNSNIKIDSLPALISTEEEGSESEIDMENDKGTAKKDINNETMIEGSSKKIENVKMIDTYLKKVEKRNMKKPILKSKFKRMGMLPVANFNDK